MVRWYNYYQSLGANYSRVGFVRDDVKVKLIRLAEDINRRKQAVIPAIGSDYTPEQIEKENKEWWPTHCEALRQGRGDILTGEYRNELVYFCRMAHFTASPSKMNAKLHWWALIAQPGVTMTWPIVLFWGEFVHFEWAAVDTETFETIAKGSVCWVRRGHHGGCYFKSEQLTFFRNVYALPELLALQNKQLESVAE